MVIKIDSSSSRQQLDPFGVSARETKEFATHSEKIWLAVRLYSPNFQGVMLMLDDQFSAFRTRFTSLAKTPIRPTVEDLVSSGPTGTIQTKRGFNPMPCR